MSKEKEKAPEAEQVQEKTEETAETNPESTAEKAEPAEAEAPAEEKENKKKEKKEKEDAAAQWEQKVSDLTDRLQRSMAEFDNYRKRTEKEKTARFEVGARSVIEKILPILDNFERGLSTVDAEQMDPFQEGMDKVYKQMVATLDELGVVPIEAVGKTFNPDFHNAVMHVEDEEAGENVIIEEFQKGYTYKGTVVRYSMVKVAN